MGCNQAPFSAIIIWWYINLSTRWIAGRRPAWPWREDMSASRAKGHPSCSGISSWHRWPDNDTTALVKQIGEYQWKTAAIRILRVAARSIEDASCKAPGICSTEQSWSVPYPGSSGWTTPWRRLQFFRVKELWDGAPLNNQTVLCGGSIENLSK